MFIKLTRAENKRDVIININHIYEVMEMEGLDGCELIFPHDKIVVAESFEKVTQMLMARNLTATHN